MTSPHSLLTRSVPRTHVVAALVLLMGAAAAGCSDPGDSPSQVRLFINELVPANAAGCVDEAGGFDDWVELYNPGPGAVDLDGFSISDDDADPGRKRFGAGLSVPADGVLVLWADGAPEEGENHLPFKLKAAAESLKLYDPEGAVVDETNWIDSIPDVSWARFPDGTGSFLACAVPTCGSKNGAACER